MKLNFSTLKIAVEILDETTIEKILKKFAIVKSRKVLFL